MSKTYIENYRRHSISSNDNEKLKRVMKDNVILVENLTTLEAVSFINKRTGSNKEGYDFGTPVTE